MNRNFGYLIILIVIYNCTSIRLENCKVDDLAVRANKNNTNAHADSAYICERMWGNFFNIYGYIYVKVYIYVDIYRKYV